MRSRPERSPRSVLPLLLLLTLAIASPAIAQSIYCDDFEAAVPCGWTIGSGCTEAICSGNGSCDGAVCSCTPASPFSFLVGDWSGTWEDTIYLVSGSVNATFSLVCGAIVATGDIDLGNLGLGVQSGSGTGTVDGSTLTFIFSADLVGGGSGTLDTAGPGSGTGSVTAPLNFGAFTFTGSANATTISGTFDFTSKSGGGGVVSLTKQ